MGIFGRSYSKKNDEIRLCNDMRRVNEAVIRERYCIPTVDEFYKT